MGEVVDRATLADRLATARAAGRRVVLTNGCFDLLHVGHVRCLTTARALGDLLVVGINSDASVRRLKGPLRPLVVEDERAEVVAALASVDLVTIFSERTAEQLVEIVRPAVYAKGADYSLDDVSGTPKVDPQRLPEARVVQEYGGTVVLIPLVPGRSTSDLVQRIRAGDEPA